MLGHWANNWWVVALRGIIAILFGLAAFIWPGITLTVLVIFFGAYAFWDGVFSVIASVRRRGQNQHWWVLFFEGLVSILVGLIALFFPGITAIAIVYLIAAWAVITGILELVSAIRLRQALAGEFLLVIAGLLSILLGVLLAIFPVAGALVTIWLIGAYAIIFGVLLLILSIRLRGHAERLQTQAPSNA